MSKVTVTIEVLSDGWERDDKLEVVITREGAVADALAEASSEAVARAQAAALAPA